jgi:hypothetical protein
MCRPTICSSSQQNLPRLPSASIIRREHQSCSATHLHVLKQVNDEFSDRCEVHDPLTSPFAPEEELSLTPENSENEVSIIAVNSVARMTKTLFRSHRKFTGSRTLSTRHRCHSLRRMWK